MLLTLLRRTTPVLLLLAALLALPGAASAAASKHEMRVQPLAMPPHSSAEQIRSIAELDRQIRVVLDYRPGAVLSAVYHPRLRSWTVHVREVGSTRDLASVEVDDLSHARSDHYVLDFDAYPPRMTERQAIAAARADMRFVREVRRHGGFAHTTLDGDYVDGTTWEVDAWRGDDVVVRAEVRDVSGKVTGVWSGHQIAWKMARGIDKAFGGEINNPLIWWPLFAAFALVMLDRRRLRSWYNLDVLALLSFVISHEAFDAGRIDLSVPLAVPPLAYLFVRMCLLFARGVSPLPAAPADAGAGAGNGARRWRLMTVPTWLLVALAVFAGGARYGVNAYGSSVIDVGYAGVAGADRVIDHQTPYGNMPADNENGDTYGPLNYLLYVPAVLVWGDSDELDWDNGLPAAHAVSIVSDLLCVFALALVGWRWISRRAAAWLACGWMVYPYTAFALCSNVNDLVVTALLLLAFAALPRAWLRGLLIAAAAAVKFVPIAVAAPMAHAGFRRRVPQVLQVGLACIAVAVASWLYLRSYHDGVDRFVKATFGFQYDRNSPFSVWGLYGWREAQLAAQGALGLLLAAAIFVPRVRDFRQLAAGAAAAMLGVQLVLQHWFYLYIPWFAGFVLVVLIAQRELASAPLRPAPLIRSHDDSDHPRGIDPRS